LHGKSPVCVAFKIIDAIYLFANRNIMGSSGISAVNPELFTLPNCGGTKAINPREPYNASLLIFGFLSF
jgi:hypothetical protein